MCVCVGVRSSKTNTEKITWPTTNGRLYQLTHIDTLCKSIEIEGWIPRPSIIGKSLTNYSINLKELILVLSPPPDYGRQVFESIVANEWYPNLLKAPPLSYGKGISGSLKGPVVKRSSFILFESNEVEGEWMTTLAYGAHMFTCSEILLDYTFVGL